jgi:hypothetical protein
MIEYQVSSATTEERHFFTSGYFQIARRKSTVCMHCTLLSFACFSPSKPFCVYCWQRLCTCADSSLLLIFRA